MTITITKELIDTCKTNFISLEELIYLYNIYTEENFELNIYPAGIYKLQRLGFLNDKKELTASGENLLSELSLEKVTIESEPSRFEEFWLAFPKDDEHHIFPKTRAIRTNKFMAEIEYDKIIKNKQISQEILIKAVKRETEYRKSFRLENSLKYMKSPVNWLRDAAYLDTDNYELSEIEEEGYGKSIV